MTMTDAGTPNADDFPKIISVDDHVIEPPDLFVNHLPAKYRDQGPRFERLDNGVDQWVFQGEVMGTVGLGATASWPRSEWSFDPVGFAEMRPGCYDVHQRVRDLNANGVLASMNFPTAAGFAWPSPRGTAGNVTSRW